MSALHTAEDSGQLDELLALHAGNVTLHNLTRHTWSGPEGAREFWQRYLSDFERIHSEFTHHTDTGALGVMEWVASGQLKGGHPTEYRGVSLIEHDGQAVTAFRTYYDSAAFVLPPSGNP